MKAREKYHGSFRRLFIDGLHWTVLLLSVLLIVFISYDTFKGIPFLENRAYMTFQLFVCLAFIADFFVELWFTPREGRGSYFRSRWLFLLLSIPYLNIVYGAGLDLSPQTLYFIRFLPLARGVLAMVIVFNYLASSKITGIFVSYVAILLMTVYFASLIFFEREQPVNPGVTSYWDSVWWCCMETTSLGCSLSPVTVVGKVLAVLLSLMGMIIFPLFTVYLSSVITRSRKRLNILKIIDSSVKTSDSPGGSAQSGEQKVAETPKNP